MAEDSLIPAAAVSLARPASLLRHLIYLLRSMRPRQWTKNGIVFMAFIFSVNQEWQPDEPKSWDHMLVRAFITAGAVCRLAHPHYPINQRRQRARGPPPP